MNSLIKIVSEEMSQLNTDILNLDLLLSNIESNNNLEIESLFLKLFSKYKCNSIIISRFILYLQLNNSESVNNYDLEDIKNLLDNSSALFPNDLDLNIERFFLYFNVLNEEEVAINNIQNFIINCNKMTNSEVVKLEYQSYE